MKELKIVLAQLNLLIGDIPGNLQKHFAAVTRARDELKADVIVFPELSLTGYPPEDLLLRKSFLKASDAALDEFKKTVYNIHCIVGHPYQNEDGLYNACSVIYNGNVLGCYAKQYLPNYGVFDERRYFISGSKSLVLNIHGIPCGIVICEDLWAGAPVTQAARAGAKIILSPNASPFEIDKEEERNQLLSQRAKSSRTAIVYVNCVGGQDDIVFDGCSKVVDSQGNICQQAALCQEELLPVTIKLEKQDTTISRANLPFISEEKRIYDCLVLALRDYVQKNNFPGVIVSVSGGIDSALVLTLAVDALGSENVSAVMLPSRYTAERSTLDAIELANNLNVKHQVISIEPVFKSLLETLHPVMNGAIPSLVEQNLQARARGVIVMALSNQTNALVLACSNRSEMATGYATLYGDMVGGFAVLKDVPKTMIYTLVNYRNALGHVIPQAIIDKAPSAELAPNQKDEDSLAPYPVLDSILDGYLNKEMGIEEVARSYHIPIELVTRIVTLVNHNEYKRRQAPLGVRINHTAFGKERRYPVTSGFKG